MWVESYGHCFVQCGVKSGLVGIITKNLPKKRGNKEKFVRVHHISLGSL